MKADNNNNEGKNDANAYVRFSALGFQMLAVVLITAFGGNYIDTHYGMLQYRPFTIVLVLLGLAGSMYLLVKELNSD